MNLFKKLLHNPKVKPHTVNVQWPLSVAVKALREVATKGKPAQEPVFRLFILSDTELEFIARAVDQALVD